MAPALGSERYLCVTGSRQPRGRIALSETRSPGVLATDHPPPSNGRCSAHPGRDGGLAATPARRVTRQLKELPLARQRRPCGMKVLVAVSESLDCCQTPLILRPGRLLAELLQPRIGRRCQPAIRWFPLPSASNPPTVHFSAQSGTPRLPSCPCTPHNQSPIKSESTNPPSWISDTARLSYCKKEDWCVLPQQVMGRAGRPSPGASDRRCCGLVGTVRRCAVHTV